jgi:selenocysteine-specific elongation factor
VTARNFIIATAGHVDHGKSALVQALTGSNPDRLPEEKARGITIDLGFAELNLTGPSGDFHAAIIDVPGHEDFVRNMIAGVGSIDLALLVVAADDGWMLQTEEHLQILTYLGVQRAVVVLTKSDLGNVEETSGQIHAQLRGTAFANARIVPTSIRTHAGIEELKEILASELALTSPQRDIDKPRLFVDRAFSLHGIGTVVTGTLSGGTFRRGQTAVVQPQNSKTRIRSLQHHGRDAEMAPPGMRTAMNLPDLVVGSSADAIKRGDVVTIEGVEPTFTFDVLVEKSARLTQKQPAALPLKNGASIYVHHGTTRIATNVVFLDCDALACGEAIAQLRLESPTLAFIGDRFVIRDRSEQYTIAGGIILDPAADRKKFRAAAQRKLLAARAADPKDLDVCVSSEVERRGPMRISTVLRTSPFSHAEITAALQRLRSRNEIIICGEIAASTGAWQALRNRAGTLVDEAHQKNSERTGVDINELRAAFHDQPGEVFESLVSDLCTNGFVRSGSIIARSSHRAALPRHLGEIAERMMAMLAENTSNPGPRKELIPNRDAQQALAFLIEQGRVVDISPEVVLLRENYEHMKSVVVDFILKNGKATVSQLREQLQTSRRVMVPFLEKLDREGSTRRIGDQRVLRTPGEAIQ